MELKEVKTCDNPSERGYEQGCRCIGCKMAHSANQERSKQVRWKLESKYAAEGINNRAELEVVASRYVDNLLRLGAKKGDIAKLAGISDTSLRNLLSGCGSAQWGTLDSIMTFARSEVGRKYANALFVLKGLGL